MKPTFLESLQEQYGSTLEGINRREKLFLASTLASHLCVLEPGETRNEIYKLSVELQSQLPQMEQAGLLEALIAQIRWGGDDVETQPHQEIESKNTPSLLSDY